MLLLDACVGDQMLQEAVNVDFLGEELLQLWIAKLLLSRLDAKPFEEVEGASSL